MADSPDVQVRVLEALESAHNYNRWLADLTLPYLGDDPIEAGSGLGTSASLWLERGVPSITVSEPTPEGSAQLRKRFEGETRVVVAQVDLTDAPSGEHSACVALNVLEHVDDHIAALRGALRLVRPGGNVVMFVPAFQFAEGRFDRMIGHYRRYTRRSLADAFERAGVRPLSVQYVNAPGLVAWFVAVRLLGRVPREGRRLRVWDKLVVPVVRRAEGRWSPPFGQSLLAIGQAR